MNTTTTQSQYTIDKLSPALERGPEWLRRRRHAAREAFNHAPLPRRGLHLWRYTDPKKFLVDQQTTKDFLSPEDYRRATQEVLRDLEQSLLAGVVIDQGGKEVKIHRQPESEKEGVIISTLSEAVNSHRELIEPYLYQLINSETGKFEALNSALFNEGIFLYIPDRVKIAHPIHLVRISGKEHSVHFPRLLVVVGKEAEAVIIDEYRGGASDLDQGSSYTNSMVEIFGAENSRTSYVPLQQLNPAAAVYLTHRSRIEADAEMVTISLSFGGAVSKQNFGVLLNGEGAQSNTYGLLFGADRQHFDNHTLHHHLASHTSSNIDFKVALRDRAESAYTGLIRIEKSARGCEAYQENRNLLLNPGTKAETIPELEILNEDVQCTHGATIGPIDPMQIFYLTSRGIEPSEAVKMVVSGFVETTLTQIPENLKERVREFVTTSLEGI